MLTVKFRAALLKEKTKSSDDDTKSCYRRSGTNGPRM